ncbi:MAG: hypothetical protein NBV68_13425, partial [Erythrobacter sp.]|uniref:hypothetical protein n=1 Tax=Erythrobacter sp. TaxID=1042 RepID=UPI0025E7E296
MTTAVSAIFHRLQDAKEGREEKHEVCNAADCAAEVGKGDLGHLVRLFALAASGRTVVSAICKSHEFCQPLGQTPANPEKKSGTD